MLLLADVSLQAVLVGSLCIAAAQLLSVPAPSGERLFLGIGVASAVPLLVPDISSVAAIYIFGMAGS